jgi:hypothetical protein
MKAEEASRLETDPALDTLLRQWAARHALPEIRAAAIRQAILSVPDEQTGVFAYVWWQRLFGGLKTSLRQSTDIRLALRFGSVQ